MACRMRKPLLPGLLLPRKESHLPQRQMPGARLPSLSSSSGHSSMVSDDHATDSCDMMVMRDTLLLLLLLWPLVDVGFQDFLPRSSAQVDGNPRVPDVCVIELGGTVGDIESMPFIEALRQFQWRVGESF